MSKQTAVFLLIFLHIPCIFSQWQQIISPTNSKINSIYFVDMNTGYFITEDVFNINNIFKTTNGGNNWAFNASANFRMKSVYFMNSQTGFIAGMEHIFVTTDGGNSWVDKPKLNYEIYDIRNVTSNYILGVGFMISSQYTTILQSYTSGSTWTSQIVYNGSTSRLHAIRFTNSGTGFTCGEYGTVMRIIDGGPWQFQVTGTTNHLYALSFLNSLTGYLAGANSTLVKTSNSGTNWLILNTGFSNIDFRAITFVDLSTGYVAGTNGFIAKTTNSGLNWLQQIGVTNANLNSLVHLNKDTLFAVGDSGVMLRTYNGGVIGINNIGSQIPGSYSLHQNYPNPFNPVTCIRFDIPKSSMVRLVIFDELGKEVSLLVQKELKAGKYSVDWNITNFTSGIYFCKLNANSFIETIKMVVVK
ncbi:MAG: YCF48-related protein [Ignavibacteria bacterium]